MTRRGRRVASLSLLSALLLVYAIILSLDDDARSLRFLESRLWRRHLRADDEDEEAGPGAFDPARVLAKGGDSPPAMDAIPGEYIVKPWVGYAQADVWESYAQTRVQLVAAQSSSSRGPEFIPRYAVEPHPSRWESSLTDPKTPEWLQIDLGGPQDIEEVYIQWEDAYAAAYTIQVGPERPNCRSNGTPCPDYWVTVADVSGKTDAEATMDSFDDETSPQGVRYMRILLNERAPGEANFSIFEVRVYRKKMVVGEDPTSTYCGGSAEAVASTLLSNHGGTLIQLYENAEFFSASMTEAQRDSMYADACTFTVEPNYVVRARGGTGAAPSGGAPDLPSVDGERRRLAIPEFNLREEQPLNWGLERISSHGRKNGKYTWYHEGLGTHVYMLDTGVYPDHTDWNRRNGTSRLRPSTICHGGALDYELNDHGTHATSLAAGFSYGTAKSADIHPIQVLDDAGEGTTASVLCGVEKLMQDSKDWNAANAPEKYRAVVNLSLGVNGRSDALDKVVKDMSDLGFLVVVAAGNSNGNACFYSPYHETAITVGALKDHPEGLNDKTAASNYGECIDLWSPGEGIDGASNGGEYEGSTGSGTSVAAAFVSGAASLYFDEVATEDLDVDELSAFVRDRIMKKAENYILEDIGHMSPNKVIQTTVSRCSINAHCEAGLTCIFDGTCRDLSRPLK